MNWGSLQRITDNDIIPLPLHYFSADVVNVFELLSLFCHPVTIKITAEGRAKRHCCFAIDANVSMAESVSELIGQSTKICVKEDSNLRVLALHQRDEHGLAQGYINDLVWQVCQTLMTRYRICSASRRRIPD